MVGIYKITNPQGKIYIGQSVDIERRIRSYKYGRCYAQPKLYESIDNFGFENHKIEVIEECKIENTNYLLEKEAYWIDFYDSVKTGLNDIAGAKPKFGKEETIKFRLSAVVPKSKHDFIKSEVNQLITKLTENV